MSPEKDNFLIKMNEQFKKTQIIESSDWTTLQSTWLKRVVKFREIMLN